MNEPVNAIADSSAHVKITLTEKESDRFWKKVNKDGPTHPTKPELGKCWLWTAGVWGRGYGAFSFRGSQIKSHRLSFLLCDPIPSETPFVLHSCDVRLCCNPTHLFLGTYADNAADMCIKGRHKTTRGDEHYSRTNPEKTARGNRLPQAKLTAEIVRRIKATHFSREFTQKDMAKSLNVSTGTISMVLSGKVWAHITQN